MDTTNTVVGTAANPVIVKFVEDLPEMAPVILRNAEGAVQVGKTALNLLKGAGVLFGTGVLIGTGGMLVAGGALSSIWAVGKAGEVIKKAYDKRQAKKEALKNAQTYDSNKAGSPEPVPAPA